jgi:glycosyltransferase involved in cell wall biosynthesis
MKFMNIHIIFHFQDGPYGGGNQFLKALRKIFRETGCYAENPEEANLFLFNSFQDIRPVLRMKYEFPDIPFVHRVDGPISLYRDSSTASLDQLIFSLNEKLADATIFQSHFSLIQNRRLGMRKSQLETIISNAPDHDVFFKKNIPVETIHHKTRLISTSWSSNAMKGFDIYQYIDEHLDFSRYEYVFVGNTPIPFKNITVVPPQPSEKIAEMLRASDIYITASKKDPCSNSLIEALSCGLPAVALNDGGHPELIKTGGELFNTPAEAIEKIEMIVENYTSYIKEIPIFSITEKSKEYVDFLQAVLNKKRNGSLIPKSITQTQRFSLVLKSFFERV